MLNVTEINKRLNAIESTLKDAPYTMQLVHELVASHLEAIAKMDEVSTELWLNDDHPFTVSKNFSEELQKKLAVSRKSVL